ncbi:MAG: PEP-CTERM sorting domain-containing protein [Kiritimatiellales bacterium]|nr:PEP-CTERM sorting domain-containing protein [Kiritimatiellales bacterium]MCF7864188.1 PEP-CTERM sorting domain-containing protein [Kiritimatiellales bacterium]
MKTIIKTMMLGALVLGGTSCFADILLLDTFNTVNAQDINTNLIARQSGTQATVAWTDSKANNYQTQIDNQALRIYASGAGSVFAQPDKDFATVATDVRISVDIRNMNPADGFSMVNFGVASADGFTAGAGYSFRFDTRTATKNLNFFDSNILKASVDVTAIATTLNSLVVDFTGGNTIAATFNGATFSFGSGQTSYTGTSETQNRVQLGWYGDGNPSLTSATFDNLTVTAIPEPATLGLVAVVCIGMLGLRRMLEM